MKAYSKANPFNASCKKNVRAIPTRLTKTWRSTDVSVLAKYLNFVYATLVGFNFVIKNDYTNVST